MIDIIVGFRRGQGFGVRREKYRSGHKKARSFNRIWLRVGIISFQFSRFFYTDEGPSWDPKDGLFTMDKIHGTNES